MTPALALELFDGQPEWSEIALVLGVAFVVASLLATALGRLVRLALTAIHGDDPHGPRLTARPVWVTRVITFALAFPITALPMLDAVGKQYDIGLDHKAVLRWLAASGVRITLIVTIAWVIIRIVGGATRRLEVEMARSAVPGSVERLKRAQTLGALTRNVAVTLISGIALMVVLRELNVDVVPMLTGAGIAGVALGFGAQWLVRDVISGFFLILEDQVRIGDLARINGVAGVVEQINLRTIVLRDVEGAVQMFPNGTISALANLSKAFSYAVVDFKIHYREDVDRVIEAAREAGAVIEKDATLSPAILAPLEVVGVVSLMDNAATVRVKFKTLPLEQGKVANELRRRLMKALSERGIRPYTT